jgi:agmatine deiminase
MLATLLALSCGPGQTKTDGPGRSPSDTGTVDTGAGGAQSAVRVPAEWEDQATVWMQWPRDHERWSRSDFGRIVAALRTHGGVRILVDDDAAEASARIFLADHIPGFDAVYFTHIETNWSWMRDNGPVWVERDGYLAVQDWGFDGWGEPNTAFAKDDAVPCQVATTVDVRCEVYDELTERGTMEFNGVDTLITSWTTLHTRNPEMSKAELEAVFEVAFGVSRIVWIEGAASDDLTDGHVDGIARFIDTETVVVGRYVDSSHPDADLYEQATATIEAAGLSVERIDIPGEFTYLGVEMSAVYLNWLVVDEAVLMSGFDHAEWDAAAQARVQTFFPDREVLLIDTRELWYSGGGVHCVTSDMPNIPIESEAGEQALRTGLSR